MKAFFGQFVDENNMDSNRVGEFYNDLKLTASEVVHSAMHYALSSLEKCQ